jgi:hypothetical protein
VAVLLEAEWTRQGGVLRAGASTAFRVFDVRQTFIKIRKE